MLPPRTDGSLLYFLFSEVLDDDTSVGFRRNVAERDDRRPGRRFRRRDRRRLRQKRH